MATQSVHSSPMKTTEKQQLREINEKLGRIISERTELLEDVELEELRRELEKARRREEETKKHYLGQFKAMQMKHSQEIEQRQKELAFREQEISKLHSKLKEQGGELDGEIRRRMMLAQELEALKAQNQDLIRSIAQLEERLKIMTSQFDSSQHSFAQVKSEQKEFHHQLEALKRQLDEKTNELLAKERMYEEYQARAELSEKMKQQDIDSLKQQLSDSNPELMKKKLQELHEADLNNLKLQFEQDVEIRVTAGIAQSNERYAFAEREIQQLTEKNAGLEKDKDRILKEYNALRAKYDELDAKATHLLSENIILSDRISASENNNTTARNELRRLEEEFKSLEHRYNDLKINLATSEHAYSSIRVEYNKIIAMNTDFSTKLAELKGAMDSKIILEKKLIAYEKDHAKERESLQQQIDALNNNLKGAYVELKTTRINSSTLLRQERESLQNEIDRLHRMVDDLSNKDIVFTPKKRARASSLATSTSMPSITKQISMNLFSTDYGGMEVHPDYIELRHSGSSAWDLTDFVLKSVHSFGSEDTFHFPQGFEIGPSSILRVWIHSKAPEKHDPGHSLYWEGGSWDMRNCEIFLKNEKAGDFFKVTIHQSQKKPELKLPKISYSTRDTKTVVEHTSTHEDFQDYDKKDCIVM